MKWTSEGIKALRDQHGLTQAKLAELIGVSPNYVHLLEKGVKHPSKTLQLLLGHVSRDLRTSGNDKF